MSRTLAELLGVPEQLLKPDLQLLEDAAGHPSHDVRLTAEITGKVQIKIKELGLDPKDTTGRELYHALNGLLQLHDGFLAKRIGGKDPSDSKDLMPRIRRAALKADMPKTAWVIKPSVAKKLLKSYPPKKLMKYLGYKSLDSMLKREPVGELLLGANLVEQRTWLEHFISKYENLSQMDFEVRPISVLLLDAKKWGAASEAYVATHRHIILSVREMGVIGMLPVPLSHRQGITITVLPQLLHHMNEIRLYTAFYKLHQMQPNLGRIMAHSLLHDEGTHVKLASSHVHWRVLQRHFGKQDTHPEVLEPHVQSDDLSWRKAEEVLFRLEPALHFWYDQDYVAMMADGQPVSFNLIDVALNNINSISYEHRFYGHFQDSLWNELYIRYMGESALEAQALRQLNFESLEEDILMTIGEIA